MFIKQERSKKINVTAYAELAWVGLMPCTSQWCITHVCARVCGCARALYVCILAPEGVTTPPKVMLGDWELISGAISPKTPVYQILLCLPTSQQVCFSHFYNALLRVATLTQPEDLSCFTASLYRPESKQSWTALSPCIQSTPSRGYSDFLLPRAFPKLLIG